MVRAHLCRRLVIAVAVLCPLSSSLAVAGEGQEIYYQAYFLEHEKGDFAAAAKLYSQVAAAKDVDADLKSQARARLAACREEIASSDLLRLMPPDALAYAELNRPGEQVGRLLKSLGLLAGDQPQLKARAGRRIAVSPVLLEELLGLRGVAVAITGFDPQSETPTGVIVINPGNLQVLRGIVESALPAAAETVESTRGRQTFFIADANAFVCLTERLIIASHGRQEAVRADEWRAFPRKGGDLSAGEPQGRPQRPLSVRQRQEVQEVLWVEVEAAVPRGLCRRP